MQFVVNGKQYFLSFVEGRWIVFTPTAQGFYRIPVVHDDQLPFVGSVVVNPGDEGRKTMN